MISIEAKDLTKKFGDFTAVNNINLEVRQGEIFGFLGSNGAGKTTTIKMLIGLLPPTKGSIYVAGIDVIRYPERVKERIGYMSQKFSLYNDLTVEENILFYAGIYGIPPKRAKLIREELLEQFDLQPIRKSLTSEIPLGLKQRLALGIALMHKPSIVFLDEPTSGTDPISRRYFWKIIQNLAYNGVTCMVTTHYLDEAEYCSRISLIDSGEIIACGTPTELKKRYFHFPIFEIDFGSIEKNIEVLNKGFDFGKFSLFGNKLHLALDKIDFDIPDLFSRLNSILGYNPITVRKIVPTLEDVFIKLVQR
ncbi:MAG: ATP-binding cassette domain-containing protein [Candidatus Kapaibacteriota bacterium]